MNKAVFLDRDGVLNIPIFKDGRSFAPRTVEEFKLFDDAKESINRLKKADYLTLVVTNQPDVGAGLVRNEVLQEMHYILTQTLEVDDVFVCTHTKYDECVCRKPKTGLFDQATQKFRIDLPNSFMVGDRHSDIEAGLLVGCRTIFIDHEYTSEIRPVNQGYTCKTLREAVDWIQLFKEGDNDD